MKSKIDEEKFKIDDLSSLHSKPGEKIIHDLQKFIDQAVRYAELRHKIQNKHELKEKQEAKKPVSSHNTSFENQKSEGKQKFSSNI